MTWELAGKSLTSHLLLGTARYPSLHCLEEAIVASGAEVITIALRRQAEHKEGSQDFWQRIKKLNCYLLPNTAGCQSAKEAILIAQMAREIFNTHWIKLEVIRDDYSLQPEPFELVIAAEELIRQGFEVFPYCTDDIAVCEKLVNLGCRIVMPGAAPIGSGKGIINPAALRLLRERLPNTRLILDAGIGAPSHAAAGMEIGMDGVLLNTAVALAADPVKMAVGFGKAIEAGRLAYQAGIIPVREFATPSTPMLGRPFWHQVATPAAQKEPVATEFPLCSPKSLGFYPIVDSAVWVERLLKLGVKTLQLRVKFAAREKLHAEIKKSIAIANQYQAALYVNDHWEEAIELGAYGVHLGQEDLPKANFAAIKRAGLHLGISTHNAVEMERAKALRPSYIAVGPIYPTKSKNMQYPPQGLDNLKQYRQSVDFPLVAIGGISLERLPSVWETGIDGVAVISAITQAANPEGEVKRWLEFFKA